MQPDSAIRIFIVDDHPLVREWLRNLLTLEADLVVIGSAGDGPSAMQAISASPPDIAVVDLTLQRGSGLDLIKDIRGTVPSVKIIVLSMHEETTDIERAFRAGASGYVMKRESTGQIVEAIRQVAAGKLFANPAVLTDLTARLVGRPAAATTSVVDALSDRELEVFRRLGEGRSTRDIADMLGVSLKTVQTYCARIKEKLGVDDAQELARTAFRWHEREHGSNSG